MSTPESQRVEACDGHNLRVDVHRPVGKDRKQAVILCHGIFTNRSESGGLDRLASLIAESGRTAMRFDFRGHGESSWSSRSFSPLAALRDLDAVVGWCNAFGHEVSLVGSSFGGGTCLLYLRARRSQAIRSVVLLNPVIDYQATFIEPTLDWGKGLFTSERVRELRATGATRLTPHFVAGNELYDELQLLEPFRELERPPAMPTLLIHGDADDKVPVEPARRAFAGGGFDYLEVEGASHGLKEASDLVSESTLEWVERH